MILVFNIHLTFERWKHNKEYNVYVSTLGNVKDARKVPIRPKVTKAGYMSINVGAKTIYLHRLVMETFKGHSNLTIDHIDSNKRNNSLKNLEYVTQEINLQRAQANLVVTEGDRLASLFKDKGITDPLLMRRIVKTTIDSCVVADNAKQWVDIIRSRGQGIDDKDYAAVVQKLKKQAQIGGVYLGYKLCIVEGKIIGIKR